MISSGSGFAYSVGLVLCASFVFNAWRRYQLRNGLPLPPGPRGFPLIGNIFDLNPFHPWLSYERWGKQYGDIVYANLLGKDFIILNSAEVAHDLLDRRSAIYSDRPYLPTGEMFSLDFISAFLPYGDKWRLHRKAFNFALGKQKAIQYKPLALRKVRQLIENFIDAPKDYAEHCKTFAGATIMAATYGYEVAPANDPFVTRIENLMDLFRIGAVPERVALLLAFPFLVHIPSWFPGGRYKQRAPACRALAEEVLTTHVEYVVEDMAAGTARKSIVRDLLEQEDDRLDRDTIQAVATSIFLGGAETTDSMLRIFILAMVQHPKIQAKAREEIDRVVGNARLPDFDDRPNLPYVEAVYLETFRWRPVLPVAVPHVTTTSDVYQGMYIPKGAMVMPNIWAIAHDETRFEDPMAFIPERHLTSDGTVVEDATHYSFGFGRRICPGRYIADQNVWAAFATILATLQVSRARDAFGKEVDANPVFTNELTSVPEAFVCSITPRSPNVENLVRTRYDKEL